MKHGYKLVKTLCQQLLEFMEKHGFETIDDFKGKSLPYFTTHADLVERQAKAKAEKEAAKAMRNAGITSDEKWDGDDFVKQSDDLVG